MNTEHDYKVTTSAEYKEYVRALCRLASTYITPIRHKLAVQAYDMYHNETVRQIVLAYGKEAEKLDEYRYRNFDYASEYPDTPEDWLKDDCLNKAASYEDTIKMLFGV